MSDMDTGAQTATEAPAQSQADTSQAAAPVAPETQAAPSFSEMLPEGVRGHALFQGIENPDQLGERLQGWQPRPQVPQTAEEYYGGPEAAKALGQLQPLVHSIAESAKAVGMPKEQFAAIVNGMAKQHHAHVQESYKQAAEALTSLSTKWGDKAEQNLNIANRVLAKFGGDALDRELEARGLSNNPALIEMFHKIGISLEDDSIITGDAPATGSLTLKDKINRMYSSTE
jgi:hypothetical protein